MKLTRYRFLFCCLIMLCRHINSHAQSINLEGTVVNENNNPLKDCNIKVSRKASPLLIAYANTGELNSFTITMKWEKPDTILVAASFTGYKTKTLAVAVNEPGIYKLDFKLEVNITELEEVVVKALPPVWKRGDTTFYNPDAFKEPGQRKLGEILAQLPGIRITETGELFYNNKKVPKITIDGEELFADKIQLLLKNFPLHVISSIQALENQNANKKLKGLRGDDEVIINITVKKDKLNVLFGDAEVGAGTKDRYLVNPVLFKLLPGIKAGLISDINNYGQSLGYQENTQLKGSSFMEAAYGNVNTYGINIPNFSNSRYIQNNLFDNRLQLNIPLKKNLKSNTELSFVKDKQRQTSTSLSSIFSDTSFFESKSKRQIKNMPLYFQASQKLDWDINKKANLYATILLAKDQTKYQDENEIFQNNTLFNTFSQIENKWSSLTVKLDYTKRVTATKAIQSLTEYGYFYFPQFITGLSDSWKTLFNLPDSGYKSLQQPYLNKASFFKSTTTYFLKIKKRVITYNLHAGWMNVHLNSQLNFKASALPLINIADLSGNGEYDIKKISSDFGYGFKAFKLPFSLNAAVGFSSNTIKEQNTRHRFLLPVISATVQQKYVFNNKITSQFEISYKTNAQDIYSLHTNIYPTGIAQFSNYRNANILAQGLSLNHSLFFRLKNYSTLRLSQYYSTDFSGHISLPSYSGILAINVDSATRGNNTSTYFVNGEYSFPIAALGTKVTITNDLSLSNGLIYNDNKIKKSSSVNNNLKLQIKRNWKKKLYLTLQSQLETFSVKLPNALQGQSFNKTVNLINLLGLRAIISKNLSSSLSVEQIQNNLTGINKTSGFFADAEVIKTFTKNRLSLRFKLENIFNQKEYLVVNRYSPLNQSFYTVPLIGRNAFLAMRIEL
jgi:hypothetical protein